LAWGEAIRVGIAHYNTLDEIDKLSDVLTTLVRHAPGRKPQSRQLRPGDMFPLDLLPDELRDGGGALERPAVVYFYPKDGTDTCTRQVVEFNRQAARFFEAGLALVGASVDTADSHREFAGQHDLLFTLLSDEDQRLATAAGVLRDYGEYGMLAGRVTFLLERSGQVSQIWEVEDVIANVADVLSAGVELAACEGSE